MSTKLQFALLGAAMMGVAATGSVLGKEIWDERGCYLNDIFGEVSAPCIEAEKTPLKAGILFGGIGVCLASAIGMLGITRREIRQLENGPKPGM